MWNFLGQGLRLCHHSDNARSLTCWATRELQGFWMEELYFIYLCLFMAAPTAYGSSQARGQIRAVAAGLRRSHSNTGSLTHQVRPGIKPMSSWILVRFVSTEPQWELSGLVYIESKAQSEDNPLSMWPSWTTLAQVQRPHTTTAKIRTGNS